MARRLLHWKVIMQIPYDLEFVQNRPTVAVRAVALRQPMQAWRGERSRSEHHGVDALLHWAFRLIRRFETSKQ
jgi:hypothetical protein